jgi:tight adherence protein C
MSDIPLVVLGALAIGAFVLSVFGLRGFANIRSALRSAELDRLEHPEYWQTTRAFGGCACGAPVLVATGSLGGTAWLAALTVAGLGYWLAPQLLLAAQRHAQREMLDDLPLHLDLTALAMEGGSSLPAALALCASHAPQGTLRRAWARVTAEIHAGTEPLEALRSLAQRTGLAPLGTLLAALRFAERVGAEFAPVLRDKARQAAASRFARAERRARAAPLKLWATLMLCLAPCTLIVLAFPLARLLVFATGR